jgi:TPR repeat protein
VAAVSENVDAQAMLGKAFQRGVGAQQDYVAPYALYNISATRSTQRKVVTKQRNRLIKFMTRSQIQAGQGRKRMNGISV